MSKLSNEKMKNLLGLQKIGNFSELIQPSLITKQQLVISLTNKKKIENQLSLEENNNSSEANFKVSNPLRSVSNPLADPLRSVSNPLADPLRSVSNPLADPLRSVSNPLADPLRSVSNPLRSVSNPLADPLRSVSNPLADPLADQQANTSTNRPENLSLKRKYNDAKTDNRLTLLSGKELIIIRYIYFLCKEKCCLITPPVDSQKLLEVTGVKPNHLRNLISRLANKQFIIIVSFKSSKQAARVFELPKHVYEKLSTMFLRNFNSDPLADPLAINPYVSSSYINTTTTEEGENNNSNLPLEWSHINYSALESYGFDEARLIQIHRAYKNNPDISLTPNIIQDSITHFAYDLEYNNAKANFRHPPAAVITSMLKKGMPYSSTTPDQVKTPREMAMLKYLESKNAADAQNKAIEDELQKVELDTWLNAMTADEILDQFYGKEELQKVGDNKIRKILALRTAKEIASEYFLMEIWPGKKQAILADASYSNNIQV